MKKNHLDIENPRKKIREMADEEKITGIQLQLERSNKKIRSSRAKRISDGLVRAQQNYVNTKANEVANLENKLEAMMDLSADNQTTSMNIIGPDFNQEDFIEELNKAAKDLKMARLKLSVAEELQKEYFTANQTRD